MSNEVKDSSMMVCFDCRPYVSGVDFAHITVLYLGEIGDMMLATKISDEMRLLAPSLPSVSGKVNGYVVFENPDGRAFAAVFDSKQINSVREAVVNTLAAIGVVSPSEHGFVPHITLAYLNDGEAVPSDYHAGLEMAFDRISVVQGNNVIGEYALGLPLASSPSVGHDTKGTKIQMEKTQYGFDGHDAMAKALDHAFKQAHTLNPQARRVWLGLSGTGVIDRVNDIVPSGIALKDIETQALLIKKNARRPWGAIPFTVPSTTAVPDGLDWQWDYYKREKIAFLPQTYFNGPTYQDFGALLKHHNPFHKLGVTVWQGVLMDIKAVMSVGFLEEGADIDGLQSMSFGYTFTRVRHQENPNVKAWMMKTYDYSEDDLTRPEDTYPIDYAAICRYENSALKRGDEANPYTMFTCTSDTLTGDEFQQRLADALLAIKPI